MVRGLPKSIIKKYGISKEAWRAYRASKRESSRSSSSGSRRSRRGGNPTAKKGIRKRRWNIPLATVGAVGLTPFVPSKPGVSAPYEFIQAGQYREAAVQYIDGWLPVDVWELVEGGGELRADIPNYLILGLAGAVTSWIASKIGLNRRLAQTRLPIRI